MDYRTAGALGQNIATIADAFINMNDPATLQKANLLRLQMEGEGLRNDGMRIKNQYDPQVYQAGIDLDRARITTEGARQATEGAQQGYLGAQTRKADSETAINGVRLQAGQAMMGGMVPFTTYSTGAAVGGPDEMQDFWTNKGYTATGKNLAPGVAAVDPSRYDIGTVFKNSATGEVFVAADKHGNANKDVVDIFKDPAHYRAESGNAPLVVVGKEKIPYGTSPQQIQAIRDRYATAANVFAGAGADDLARAQARNAMLAAGGDEQAGRNAAAAISGQLPGAGEYSTPAAAAAFQRAGIEGELQKANVTGAHSLNEALQVEQLRQQGENQREALGILYGGRSSSRSSSGGGAGNISGVSMIEPTHEMLTRKFGTPSDDGAVISPEMQTAARAYQMTFANLVDNGVSPISAEVIADQHHGISHVAMDKPLLGANSMKAGSGYNFEPMTSDVARQFAPALSAGGAELSQLAQAFGLATGPGQPAAPQQQPSAVPQTGATQEAAKPAPLPGRRLGVEAEAAEVAETRQDDAKWNNQTMMLNIRAIEKSGLSWDDVYASAFGSEEDQRRLLWKLEGTGWMGRRSIPDLRNALLDNDVAGKWGADPARALQYLQSSQGAQQAAPQTRRYNPATGAIE